MNIQRHISHAGVAVALALSQSALGLMFAFDPAGTGTTGLKADTIIHAPGNALAIGGVTAFGNSINGVGSVAFTLDYQANLARLQLSNNPVFSQGTGGQFFTFAMSFGETVTTATVGVNTANATYAFDPANPSNFFKIYATSASGNDLTGAGFGTGTPILSAHFIASSGKYTTTLLANPNLYPLMDQFGPDNWSGQKTASGIGTFTQSMIVDSVDADYFPDLLPNTILTGSFLSIIPGNPYFLADPSLSMLGTVPNIGSVNGISGPDELFEADPTQVFFRVPEPATLALISLGLAGMGFGKRRRSARQQRRCESLPCHSRQTMFPWSLPEHQGHDRVEAGDWPSD